MQRNCTECISFIQDQKACGRGFKVSLPERTICRKYLQHKVAEYGGGRETTHYLVNANGQMFDVTKDVLASEKKVKEAMK